MHDVEPRDDRQRDREPQERRGTWPTRTVGGSSTTPTARNWKNAFHLPSLRAGSEIRAGRRTSGTCETPTSRTVTISTADPREVAVDAEREEPAEHEELVGQRIEERAGAGGAVAAGSQPSRPSVVVSTNHSDTVSQLDPWSMMSSSVGTARSSRAMVTRFAGVAMASSTAVDARARGRRRAHGRALRHQVRPDRLGDVRGTSAPGRASRRSRTTPSISGASRCVRPTSTPSSSSARRPAPRSPRRRARRAAAWVIGLLHRLALAQPLEREVGVDRVVERRPRACRPRVRTGRSRPSRATQLRGTPAARRARARSRPGSRR